MTTTAPSFELTTYTSQIDGAAVAEIATHQVTGRVRIYLNEAPTWDADPETNDPAGHGRVALAAYDRDPTPATAQDCVDALRDLLPALH